MRAQDKVAFEKLIQATYDALEVDSVEEYINALLIALKEL